MGYSTTLYAVNIDKLAAAIGSNDEGLINRLHNTVSESTEQVKETPKEPSESMVADVTVKISNDGRTFFCGTERTLEQVCFDLIKVPGGIVEFVIETPWSDFHDEVIRTTNEVIPRSGIDKVITRFASDDPGVDTTPNVTWSRDEDSMSSKGSGSQDYNASPEALSDLVYARLDSSGPEHGRALEVLCFVLGMKLPDEDLIGDLEPLNLDSPLQQARCPIAIQSYEDFPVISYLTSEETLSEAHRISKLDISFPDDEDIEEARIIFLRCLKQAAIEGLGVVAFYQ